MFGCCWFPFFGAKPLKKARTEEEITRRLDAFFDGRPQVVITPAVTGVPVKRLMDGARERGYQYSHGFGELWTAVFVYEGTGGE